MPNYVDYFDLVKPRDIAVAVAASNRIILEHLYRLGANREDVERDYKAKIAELLVDSLYAEPANLLRMMSDTIPPISGWKAQLMKA